MGGGMFFKVWGHKCK